MINPVVYTNIINANLNMLGNIRKQNGRFRKGNSSRVKVVKVKEPPAIIKQKFNEAWEKQEERLSKFKTELTDSWCYSEYGPYSCGGHEYRYENGNLAEEMHYSDMENSRTVTRYDPEGNCVEKGSCKFVYYENSSQKEFEWRDDGIKHFDKQGNDDTKKYYLKHQIATKRIKAEGKGTTFSKMSKLEKAVAVLNVDKPELTMLEKMLLKKAKNRS